jgi:RNA polymerase sigma factor (sigma-70 family)
VEASALTHASRRGLLARRSPVLKLQGDEKLVALIRDGHARGFEVLFDRYQSRLLAFCQHMLGSREDAEDVLQEVFIAAHKAMLADTRHINARPWLYRIARNRCLNHLRRPVPDGVDSMDIHPHENGTTTFERVENREEFRRLLADVKHLPETQRTALLLREVDGMSYEEIAQSMETTVPSVKSLLVRARITLAEASQARLLTCGEVQLELAEAAEGLRKASGPVRQHVRDCETCDDFRAQLRNDSKALAALAPLGVLALAKEAVLAKVAGIFGGGTSTAGGGAAAGGAGAGAAGGAAGAGAAAGGMGGAIGAAGAAGGVGAGAIGAKAAAGVATAALLTAGAVEVNNYVASDTTAPKAAAATAGEPRHANAHGATGGVKAPAAAEPEAKKPESLAPPPPIETEVPAETPDETVPPVDPSATGDTEPTGDSGAPSHGSPTVTETVSVAPAASYTWTTGTVQPAPGDTTGETPPSDPPPVGDGSAPPPPPPPLPTAP